MPERIGEAVVEMKLVVAWRWIVSLSAKPLSLLLLLVFSLGCATTSMRSQVDPAATARGFRKVMVVGNFSDLGLRQDAEQEFVKTLASKGLQRALRQRSCCSQGANTLLRRSTRR